MKNKYPRNQNTEYGHSTFHFSFFFFIILIIKRSTVNNRLGRFVAAEDDQ